MLHLRHILHPVRSARSLYRRLNSVVAQRRAERPFRQLRRAQRDRCWCGGELLPFKWHASFKVCARCGSYVNWRPPMPEELERLYSIDLYWRTRQRLKGIPTIEDRAALYRADGRLDQWLGLVAKYGPSGGRVIEVGCAPGVLLEELSARGYDCLGVEISPDVAEWLRRTTGIEIRSGAFPGIELPQCDLFLSFDVWEHSYAPQDFLREVARCLRPGGVAIIQTAVERYDYTPPFGVRQDMFDDVEHLFLFTDRAIEALAREAGLEIVSLTECLWLAGEVCVFRRP